MSSNNERHPPMGSESDRESLGGSNAPSSAQYVVHSSSGSSEEMDDIALRVRALLSEVDVQTPTVTPHLMSPPYQEQQPNSPSIEFKHGSQIISENLICPQHATFSSKPKEVPHTYAKLKDTSMTDSASRKLSMASTSPTYKYICTSQENKDDIPINAGGKEEFISTTRYSDCDTPPLSSVASCKNLDWDNAADIGYIADSHIESTAYKKNRNKQNFFFPTEEFDLNETSMFCNKAQLIDEVPIFFHEDRHFHSLNIVDKDQANISDINRDLSEEKSLKEETLLQSSFQPSTASGGTYSSHQEIQIQMHSDLSVRPKDKSFLKNKSKFPKKYTVLEQQSSSSTSNISEKSKYADDREPLISQPLRNQNVYKNVFETPTVLRNISEQNVIELAAPEEHSLKVENLEPPICQPEDFPENYQRNMKMQTVKFLDARMIKYIQNEMSLQPSEVSEKTTEMQVGKVDPFSAETKIVRLYTPDQSPPKFYSLPVDKYSSQDRASEMELDQNDDAQSEVELHSSISSRKIIESSSTQTQLQNSMFGKKTNINTSTETYLSHSMSDTKMMHDSSAQTLIEGVHVPLFTYDLSKNEFCLISASPLSRSYLSSNRQTSDDQCLTRQTASKYPDLKLNANVKKDNIRNTSMQIPMKQASASGISPQDIVPQDCSTFQDSTEPTDLTLTYFDPSQYSPCKYFIKSAKSGDLKRTLSDSSKPHSSSKKHENKSGQSVSSSSLKRRSMFSEISHESAKLRKNGKSSYESSFSSKDTMPKTSMQYSKGAKISLGISKDAPSEDIPPEERSASASTQLFSVKRPGMFTERSQEDAKLRKNVVRSSDENSSSSEEKEIKDSIPGTFISFSRDAKKSDFFNDTPEERNTAIFSQTPLFSIKRDDIVPETSQDDMNLRWKVVRSSDEESPSSEKDSSDEESPSSEKDIKDTSFKSCSPFSKDTELSSKTIKDIPPEDVPPEEKSRFEYLEERTFEDIADTKNVTGKAVILHGAQDEAHSSDSDNNHSGNEDDNKKADPVTTPEKFEDASPYHNIEDIQLEGLHRLRFVFNTPEKRRHFLLTTKRKKVLKEKDENISQNLSPITSQNISRVCSKNYDIIFSDDQQTIVDPENSPLHFPPTLRRPLRCLSKKNPRKYPQKSPQKIAQGGHLRSCQKSPQSSTTQQRPLTPKDTKMVEGSRRDIKKVYRARAKRFSKKLAESAAKGKVDYSLQERVMKTPFIRM